MHCLGAVAETMPDGIVSDGQVGNRESLLNVVRALGVLVCEGRIQGPPRGYKEGPHCAAPLQTVSDNHTCEEDHYLCNRYRVLVKEIAERATIGSNLCIEVVVCNDCPCGLSTATSTNPVSPIPSTQMQKWPNAEMLLEYWCISVVASKNSEMMNSQGLYQAVRSRLHFSQVAAWWSRSNGAKPKYVATRVVPYNGDNLRKFREIPIEHTFPLASIGDGYSVKVSVWALPRMEAIPELKCSDHPSIDAKEDEVARALTPTKNTSVSHNSEQPMLVMPALVDDRLQLPCNKSGKHHCKCEEEDASPPSPSIKSNGERKRRRSLPCGPPDIPINGHQLESVSESTAAASGKSDQQNRRLDNTGFETKTYLNTGTLERFFWTQVSLDETEGNDEKRYKPSSEAIDSCEASNNADVKEKSVKSQCFVTFNHENSHWKRSPAEPNLVVNPFAERNSFHQTNPGPSSQRKEVNSVPCTVHVNYSKTDKKSPTERISHQIEKNDKYPSNDLTQLMSKLSFPKDRNNKSKEENGIFDWFSKVPGRVLNAAPSTMVSLVDNKNPSMTEQQQEKQRVDQGNKGGNGVKLKNCNLELSQREFDEVLAVLRTRTPSTRRRPPVRILRRRDRFDKSNDDNCVCPIHRDVERKLSAVENCGCRSCKKFQTKGEAKNIMANGLEEPGNCLQNVSNKADVLLGAILRTSRNAKGLVDISNGTRPRSPSTHEKLDNNQQSSEQQQMIATAVQSDGRITRQIDTEEDKFLPMALNKRLHRLKQLFRKEQTADVSSSNAAESAKDSLRVRRKIDFSVGVKSEQSYKPLVNDPIHQNHDVSHSISTNYKFKDYNQHGASANASSASGEEDNDRKIKETLKAEDEEACDNRVPSAIEQERFRRSLENAASMVFHSRTGLPLTSSPAPLRRGSCCFDYDSSLNTVSSKRSALFELNTPPSPGVVSLEETDKEIDNTGEGYEPPKRSLSTRNRPQSHALLGNFEESALNGRLEPVSTVHGFTAEIGASGSFCPKHRKLPVTVFFYTLGDNDKVSSPYLAHINLEKKGYQVPRSGTIQVTLLNPLGTVVKMFVVLYDLSDMPPRSHTFLRQRTLRDKTLRYLIHLRFMSGKSGRIYLHTDIRMIICRKSDVDTAYDFGSEPPKELRSYIHGPTNPKFSPRC